MPMPPCCDLQVVKRGARGGGEEKEKGEEKRRERSSGKRWQGGREKRAMSRRAAVPSGHAHEEEEEEEEAAARLYEWEKNGRPKLASEPAVGRRTEEGTMAFGGVAFSGVEQTAPTGEEDKKNAVAPPVLRRGLARAVVVAMDWGATMTQTEPAPLRSAFLLRQMTEFVGAFFAANPLSQLSLVSTGAGTAERLSPLFSAKSAHLAALAELAGKECEGEISLQHCVELGIANLRHVSAHVSRELLLIVSSLSTCDPGDLNSAAISAKHARIRISIIHFSGAMFAGEQLCRATGGTHAVMVDKTHFSQILFANVSPQLDKRPPGTAVALVPTGFPLQTESTNDRSGNDRSLNDRSANDRCSNDRSVIVACGCHRRVCDSVFFCPVCSCPVCELPTCCPVCSLSLAAASHLARSYRHLFPVPFFSPQVLTAWKRFDRIYFLWSVDRIYFLLGAGDAGAWCTRS